jgi:superkiller protein 3
MKYDSNYFKKQIKLGKYQEAIEICDKSPEFDLKSAPIAWNLSGDALRSQSRYEDAIKYYNKTLKQDPKNEEAWINKGKAIYLLGRPSESVICFDKALELNVKNAKVWAMKGVALKTMHKYIESEAAFAKAKELGYHDKIMK